MWSNGLQYGTGVTCHDLDTDERLESPDPIPFIHWTKYKNIPIHLLIVNCFHLFIYACTFKFTYMYSYNFCSKTRPVDILLKWKWCPFLSRWLLSYTHSSRTSVYTFTLMKVIPPCNRTKCIFCSNLESTMMGIHKAKKICLFKLI